MNLSLRTAKDVIVEMIVKLSKERQTADPVRDLYSTWLDISTSVTEKMALMRKEERERK